MSFTVITSVSPNYADVLKFCMPSWIKWSGASNIVVNQIEADPCDDSGETWYRNVILRCESMRDSTLAAMKRGERVLALDIDCVTLADLSGGFSDGYAFSAACWPEVNMGVLFFNTPMQFPFCAFLDEMATSVRERCESLIANPGEKWTAGDEDVWREMLQREESHVHKLDWREWNFCNNQENWDKEIGIHRDKIRIAHLKARKGMRPVPLNALQKHFPGKL